MPNNNMKRASPQFGVSFSLKQCRNFGLDPHEVLDWLIIDAGFKRFRLMSYWDEHQPQPGALDLSGLDWQMDRIARAGGTVTLCLGARQPRWPENHWPEWAWQASKTERSQALLRYIQAVVERYRHHPALASYQLENEALLTAFGERAEVDRPRLRQELALVKQLDPAHPIIMSTSDPWGIPLRRPTPDIVGFSYYHIAWTGKRYIKPGHFAFWHRARRQLIKLLKQRPVFVHELQLEPWGPRDIWQMPASEQDRSMGPAGIARSVRLARKTRLSPIDLWGGEWWYWRLEVHHDPTIWQAVQQAIKITK